MKAARRPCVLPDAPFWRSSERVNVLRIFASRRACSELRSCYWLVRMTGVRGSRSVSGNSELFEELPEQRVPQAPGRGTPRLRQPERHQRGWHVAAIDDLVARDHPVGAGSFRRRERLGKLAAAATARVERLRAELEADPAAGDRRQRAAQQRAAREQEERVQAALDRMRELEAERTRREKTNKAEVGRQKEPRASTTDAEARTMKMADGGFRPAYNMQIVSAPKGQVIVAVDIDTTGSDRGLARPALEQLAAGGTRPSDYLVDGGFTKKHDIEWAHASGIKLWCPPAQNKHGSDPYAPRSDDK